MLAIICYLSYNSAAFQATNECLTSGEENTKSDGIMFEYMQLLVCYILINIISLENILTMTVNTRVNLVAVNDMCNKDLLFFPLKNKKINLCKKEKKAGSLNIQNSFQSIKLYSGRFRR